MPPVLVMKDGWPMPFNRADHAPWDDKIDRQNYGDAVVAANTYIAPWDSSYTRPLQAQALPAGVPALGVPAGVPAGAGVPATGGPLRDTDGKPGKRGQPPKYADLYAKYMPHDPLGYNAARERRKRQEKRMASDKTRVAAIEGRIVLKEDQSATMMAPKDSDPPAVHAAYKAWLDNHKAMQLQFKQARASLLALMEQDQLLLGQYIAASGGE